MLKSILRGRIGRYVPFEHHDNIFPPVYKLGSSSEANPIVARTIRDSDTDSVKSYMRRTFYMEAPIPQVLQLSRHCAKTHAFLDKEMDLFIQSGVSIKFVKDQEPSKVLGVGFSVTWKQNPSYEIVGANVRDWHNAAAELAAEWPHHDEKHLIWRDLQYQHIYDLSQRVLTQSRKPHLVYLAMLVLSPEIRGQDSLSDKFLGQIPQEDTHSIMVQSNFRGFDKTVFKSFPKTKLVDQVKYSEEELIVNSDCRAFKIIDHLDGIRFFAQL